MYVCTDNYTEKTIDTYLARRFRNRTELTTTSSGLNFAPGYYRHLAHRSTKPSFAGSRPNISRRNLTGARPHKGWKIRASERDKCQTGFGRRLRNAASVSRPNDSPIAEPFIRDRDTAFREQILDVAKAEREPQVESDRLQRADRLLAEIGADVDRIASPAAEIAAVSVFPSGRSCGQALSVNKQRITAVERRARADRPLTFCVSRVTGFAASSRTGPAAPRSPRGEGCIRGAGKGLGLQIERPGQRLWGIASCGATQSSGHI